MGHLPGCEVEEGREGSPAVGQSRRRDAQFVEERVRAPLQGPHPPGRRVRQRRGDEVHGVLRRFVAEDLPPLTRLDLREFEFDVIRIHRPYLLLGRRPQHFDDLHELIDARITRKEWLPQQQLRSDAPLRPDIDGRRVIGGTEDQLRSPVVPRTDVTHVGFARHQRLGTAEIAQLQLLRGGVHQKVLRLDVAVTYPQGVYVRQRAAQLVQVQLDVQQRQLHPVFLVPSTDRIDRLGYEFQHEVQVQFIRLFALFDNDHG